MLNRITMLALLAASLIVRPTLAQVALPSSPLTQAENATAVDLYGKLKAQPGNLFFSPSSISTAMGMVFAGAKGDTAGEIAAALHLNLLSASNADLRSVFLRAEAQQIAANNTASTGFELHEANAMWAAANYPFSKAYINSIQTSFGAALKPTDFSNEPDARANINNWVAAQTNNKIQDLIGPGILTADTRMVLTNAIYFKSDWEKSFEKSDTYKQMFHVEPGTDVSVDMMHDTDSYALTTAPGVKILQVSYRFGTTALVVILPDDNAGLPAIEAGLTAAQLNTWLAGGQDTLVALTLPKFTTSGAFDLNHVLMMLGINKAFSESQADLTDIANVPGHPLYVGSVIHQAYVDVDETGTEAAAATAVTMMATAAAPSPVTIQPVPFVADHPFLYLIRNNQTGEILFMGRMANPAE
ncbi:MAG: serpin family protein [Acidocella sp.]|nr:serpin family protein [Acidocella sp.]